MAILVTHNDLDGVTCAILFKAAFPDGNVRITSYDEVDRVIQEAMQQPGFLYITDISPQSRELAVTLQERGDVRLIDHHKTAEWLSEFPYTFISRSACAAKLFLSDLSPDGDPSVLSLYHALVWHANDYDMWRHESKLSADLNRLLYVLGEERFMERFLDNPSVVLTETEQYLLQLEAERAERYITKAVERATVYEDFALTFAENYIPEVGQKLLDTYQVPIAVIVDASKRKISLRSRGTDVSVIAKELDGGGHPRAAGGFLPALYLEMPIAALIRAAIDASHEDHVHEFSDERKGTTP